MRRTGTCAAAVGLLVSVVLAGCASAPPSSGASDVLHPDLATSALHASVGKAGGVSALTGTLANTGSGATAVVGGVSVAADRVQVVDANHATVAAGVRVGSTATVQLSVDGIHLQLAGLRRPLVVGDSIDVILVSDAGVATPLAVSVR